MTKPDFSRFWGLNGWFVSAYQHNYMLFTAFCDHMLIEVHTTVPISVFDHQPIIAMKMACASLNYAFESVNCLKGPHSKIMSVPLKSTANNSRKPCPLLQQANDCSSRVNKRY